MCVVETDMLSEKWIIWGKYRSKRLHEKCKKRETWLHTNLNYFNWCLLIKTPSFKSYYGFMIFQNWNVIPLSFSGMSQHHDDGRICRYTHIHIYIHTQMYVNLLSHCSNTVCIWWDCYSRKQKNTDILVNQKRENEVQIPISGFQARHITSLGINVLICKMTKHTLLCISCVNV